MILSSYMKVQELVEKLGLKVLAGANGLNREIDGCYISDLLSDVMGNADAGNIWITLQTHKNVMAVASLKELACVILVKNLIPNEETIGQSDEESLPLLQTNLTTYEIAGKVYNLLNG
jgi:Serine kinase of the HPr protein, regulates carbohydrate metabolism